jgi:hypothetical protein
MFFTEIDLGTLGCLPGAREDLIAKGSLRILHHNFPRKNQACDSALRLALGRCERLCVDVERDPGVGMAKQFLDY